MLNDSLWNSIHFFLEKYVHLKKNDNVVIFYTPDSRDIAGAVKLALTQLEISCEVCWMKPIKDDFFFDRARKALPVLPDGGGRLVILTFEKDTFSHDRKIYKLLSAYPPERLLIYRAISSCPELFTNALSIAPEEINQFNSTLLNYLMSAKKVHIKTKGGTNLNIELNNEKHSWVSNRGLARVGRTVILPPGEVATYPANVTGIFVADFAFNLNAITDQDTRLQDRPVTLYLDKGIVVEYHSKCKDVIKFLDQCFERLNAKKVGELGFGTNRNVHAPLYMNSHINERKPGVHLGFGQHNQPPGVVGYQCELHLDMIADGGTIWIDDIPKSIDLSSFLAEDVLHTDRFTDEDVFSPELDDISVEDCCGVYSQGEMKLFNIN